MNVVTSILDKDEIIRFKSIKLNKRRISKNCLEFPRPNSNPFLRKLFESNSKLHDSNKQSYDKHKEKVIQSRIRVRVSRNILILDKYTKKEDDFYGTTKNPIKKYNNRYFC